MTAYYPIVIETETSGAVSAYVPGLPVYAAADTHTKTEQAIRKMLAAYLDAHDFATARIRVARVSTMIKRGRCIAWCELGQRGCATRHRSERSQGQCFASERTARRPATAYRSQGDQGGWSRLNRAIAQFSNVAVSSPLAAVAWHCGQRHT